MENSAFTDQQRAEIKELVIEAIHEYFEATGMTLKSWMITIATIVASITVIMGGARAALSWIGFTYIK